MRTGTDFALNNVPNLATAVMPTDPLALTAHDGFAVLVSLPEVPLALLPDACPGRGRRRARRFRGAVPVRYRLANDPQWHAGMTENFSASGVLFQTSRSDFGPDWRDGAGRGIPLELILELPSSGPDVSRLTFIRCQGKIVRATTTGAAEPLTSVAVAVRGYDL